MWADLNLALANADAAVNRSATDAPTTSNTHRRSWGEWHDSLEGVRVGHNSLQRVNNNIKPKYNTHFGITITHEVRIDRSIEGTDQRSRLAVLDASPACGTFPRLLARHRSPGIAASSTLNGKSYASVTDVLKARLSTHFLRTSTQSSMDSLAFVNTSFFTGGPRYSESWSGPKVIPLDVMW